MQESNEKFLVLLLPPSKNTTSFRHPHNIHNVKTTSYGRQNNVVCILGFDKRKGIIHLYGKIIKPRPSRNIYKFFRYISRAFKGEVFFECLPVVSVK